MVESFGRRGRFSWVEPHCEVVFWVRDSVRRQPLLLRREAGSQQSILESAARPAEREQERESNMKTFTNCVKNFLVSEDGPTAVEYAVMLALIIVVCITSITAVGTAASAKFNSIATTLN